jgi:dihydrofolate synthase/folylpolyglutamate synthase
MERRASRSPRLDEAAAFLEGLINHEREPRFSYRRLGLGPIRRLLERLGHPERALSVIHVAGSKGKGSTCLLAEAVLRAAGERVGTFTSPHLERWTERVRIGGAEVAPDALADAVERLRPHVEAERRERPEDAPTFFDAVTASALLVFADARLDRVLLEVGLGGRLDSTNAVAPAVTCITGIELEHTDKLGGTFAEIAREKAGILKPRVPCVAGAMPGDAEAVVVERARALDVPLFRVGREIRVEAEPARADAEGTAGLSMRYEEDGGLAFDARLPVLGRHQALNAALAVAAVRRLGVHDDAVIAGAAREGFAGVVLPGRVELFRARPWIVVDGAHTGASARALAEALAALPARRAHLVLSVSVGKDLAGILDALLPLAGRLTVTRAEPRRSLSPQEVAAAVRAARPGLPLRVVPNPHLALRAARASLGAEDLLCATGSVYLAGIARAVLANEDAPAPLVSRRSPPTPAP